jgi:hypothetical protein
MNKVQLGKNPGMGVIRERRQSPAKPKGKRDSEGRYNFSKGGSANLVASAMEVQKPN